MYQYDTFNCKNGKYTCHFCSKTVLMPDFEYIRKYHEMGQDVYAAILDTRFYMAVNSNT